MAYLHAIRDATHIFGIPHLLGPFLAFRPCEEPETGH
jgi:hypothetical protein